MQGLLVAGADLQLAALTSPHFSELFTLAHQHCAFTNTTEDCSVFPIQVNFHHRKDWLANQFNPHAC